MESGAAEATGFVRERPEAAGERLGELFDAHGRMIYGLCAVLLRDPHEAEDAAQEAFLSAYASLRAGVTPLRPEAWLAAIARNECLDRLRKRAREPRVPLDREPCAEGVEEIAGRQADFAVLRSALAELPARQRDALLLHELCGLSYVEIAQILGVSQSAVESLLFRGRQRLHDRAGSLFLFSGAVIVPLSLGEGLARAVPGFTAARAAQVAAQSAPAAGGSAVSGSGLVAASAKLAAAPLAAKLAVAASVALVAAGATSIVSLGTGRGKPAGPVTSASAVRVASAVADAAEATVDTPSLSEAEIPPKGLGPDPALLPAEETPGAAAEAAPTPASSPVAARAGNVPSPEALAGLAETPQPAADAPVEPPPPEESPGPSPADSPAPPPEEPAVPLPAAPPAPEEPPAQEEPPPAPSEEPDPAPPSSPADPAEPEGPPQDQGGSGGEAPPVEGDDGAPGGDASDDEGDDDEGDDDEGDNDEPDRDWGDGGHGGGSGHWQSHGKGHEIGQGLGHWRD